MTVFVTVGLERKPFSRLVAAIDRMAGSGLLPTDCLVQHGHTPFHPVHVRAVSFLPLNRLKEELAAARLVIAHAGVGSVLLAIQAGKCPVVVPRRRALGEHVDDHQITFTRMMGKQGLVIPAIGIPALETWLQQGEWTVPDPPVMDPIPSMARTLRRLVTDLALQKEDHR